MKKILSAWCFIILLVACKKNGADTGPGNDNPPPFSGTGGVIISTVQQLQLHVGDKVIPGLTVYDEKGLPVQTASFTFSSDSDKVASGSGGAINALATGTVFIKVSDGIHADAYIQVTVLPDSVPIPAGPANISFSPMSLSLKPGEEKPIPAYTITDYKGNKVTVSPSFEFIAFDKAIVVGNATVKAGQSSGLGYLAAKYNGAYLHGSLPVAVYLEKPADTVRGFRLVGKYPSVFNYYKEPAPAIRIEVMESWFNASGIHFNWYQTVPDKITTGYPKVLVVNGQGVLESNYPGITPVNIYFKDKQLTMYSGVNIDMSGSWNASGYTFCIGRELEPIIYNVSQGSESLQTTAIVGMLNRTWVNPVYGKANVANITTPTSNYGCSVFASPRFGGGSDILGAFDYANTWVGMFWLLTGTVNTSNISYPFDWINDAEKIKLRNGTILTRGAGDCTIASTGGLYNTLTGHTWVPNTCLADNIDASSFSFNANGTWSAPGFFFTGEYPISWSCPDDQTIRLLAMMYNDNNQLVQETINLYVSAYNATSVSLADPRNGSTGGCTPILNRQ